MKAFIKQWILLFGFVVIAAYVIPPIFNGYWESTWFILKLLVTTLTVYLFVFLLEKVSIEPPFLRHFVNMCVVLGTVWGFGWIWEWYTPSGFWIIPAMVIPVYVLMALLDAIKIRRDVESINQQIQYRKLKQQENEKEILQ